MSDNKKLHFTSRILIAALLLCGLAFMPFSANAEETRLRFANFPAAGTFPCVSMERWAVELEKRTNGAVKIETFPGGTLLEAKNMVRGVMQGQADIGCISLAYHPGAYPFLSVFELPLGFSSAADVSAAMWETHQRHLPKETSRIKVIALFSSSPSQIMSTVPVTKAEDLKGLKFRSSGILADVAESMGMLPVSMPQSDTPDALQKSIVQGVFSSFDVLKDYNFAESCRYGMIVDGPVYPFMFFMNMDAWESLPAETQAAVMELAAEHSAWTGEYVDAHGLEAVKWAEETYGFTLAALDGEAREALRQNAAPVIEKWKEQAGGRGVEAEALLEEVMSFVK